MEYYLKWFEIAVIPSLLAIATIAWSFQGGYLPFFLIIFTLVFSFFLYQLNASRTVDKNFLKPQQAFNIGFKINSFEVEHEVLLSGGFKERRTIELEIVEGTMFSKEHNIRAMGDESVGDVELKVSKIQGNSDVSLRIIQQSPKEIVYLVEFSPALKKGEKITYEIYSSVEKGAYLMTKGAILDCIKAGKWIFPHPFAFYGFLQAVPARYYSLTVLLPKEFKIFTVDDYFDVIIEFSGNRLESEYRRLQDKNAFTRGEKDNKQMLKLSVENTVTNLAYLIKWIPTN